MGITETFAAEVGPDGPVTVVGGRTQWDVGGEPDGEAKEVTAPAGIYEYDPAEMTVRCGAGTTVAELQAELGEAGQMVPFDPVTPEAATVGGLLSVGQSGLRRLRYGPMRDLLLQVIFVNAEGELVKAGGPTVKNVSGFDLCRLLVGAIGTLGLFAEVILRCYPLPERSQWFVSDADPFALHDRLYRPSTILWDGATTWVLLEGHPDDVAAQAELGELGPGNGQPALPTGGRESLRPRDLPSVTGEFVAEVGVGVVHRPNPVSAPPQPQTTALQHRIKAAFDPSGRLNPGRTVIPA